MENQLIVQFKSGQTMEGFPLRSMGNNDIDMEIFVEKEKRKLLFSLDEICTIRFAKIPTWATADEPTTVEKVQTVTGDTFRVSVFTNRKFLMGFIALIEDPEASFRTIFFTFSGVRNRHEERLIGEILREDGLVTNNHLADALKTQQQIRNRRIGEVIVETTDVTHEAIEKTLEEHSGKPKIPANARIGDILIEAGLVTRDQVEKAFESQLAGKKMKVGEILISQGLITEEQLLAALARKFRLRFVDLTTIVPSDEALGAISEALATRLLVFPISIENRRLTVATSAPTDPSVGDSLRFSTNYSIDFVVATAVQISAAIDMYYHRQESSIDNLLESMKMEADSLFVEEEDHEAQVNETDSEVIGLINRILLDAYGKGASDIHFEPGSGKSPLLVRYRIDGECIMAHKIATTFKSAINSRIKIISGLDISERRRPQSGKILLRSQQRKLEYRVEITPTVGGYEDAVLRLLSASKPLPLDEMGFMPYTLERFKSILDKPYGLILCVGPTGSGKTTTLHSALSQINSPKRKIWTVEDPVEITQAGLRQVQVNPKIGFSFPEALRSFLRADPDVIMVGEMRDVETARIAIEASLTGHLVFSTLHTNSAPESAVRLIEMGIDPFNFADSLLGIVAQRLAKKLCDKCKKIVHPSREEYEKIHTDFMHDAGAESNLLPAFEETAFMMAVGCDHCGGSGYKGRIPIHEMMLGTPAIKEAVRERRGVAELRQLALDEGMWTLKMDGIKKVFMGLTDMEHILKVCI